MSSKPLIYPFCAVVGQERAKKSLLLHAIHPRLGGVLLYGDTGTSKTTLVRGLAELLPDSRRLDVPLHSTEDRLLGGLDTTHAIRTGQRKLSPGLLAEADGQIITVEDANLLSRRMLKAILEASRNGWFSLEREGMSERLSSQFRLFGTMNPEEGELTPALLDLWGLHVRVETINEPAERIEIIRRRLAFERDAAKFVRIWQRDSRELQERLQRAIRLLPDVQVSGSLLRLAAEIAAEGGCPGHRAEVLLAQTARAIAAWEGRTEIKTEHMHEAAVFVLPHRLSIEPVDPSASSDGMTRNEEADSHAQPPGHSGPSKEASDKREGQHRDMDGCVESPISDGRIESSPQSEMDAAAQVLESVETIGREYGVRRFDFVQPQLADNTRSGKRNKSGPGTGRGRYVRSSVPKGPVRDLAFDATLRAAAPFQRIRREHRSRNGKSGDKHIRVLIERGDLRTKVRESRMGTALLFIVDASGSMNAAKRMQAVKGAVLSLLRDAYLQRDYVGLIAFRGDRAELLLDMTRSVELAERKLRMMPTGGRTPLAAGLAKGAEVLNSVMLRKSGLVPAMIVITDGKANAGFESGIDAWQESRKLARQIAASGTQALVIDTEGYIRLGFARKLAIDLHAQYCLLEELEAGGIERAVRGMLGDTSNYYRRESK